MTQIRIGDAERDAAAAALGEHYAAGRLTKSEYDERVDQVWAARFEQDLQPLFADLPRGPRELAPRASQPEPSPRPRPGSPPWSRQGPWPVVRIMPILVISLIAIAIFTGTPWLLFGLFWLWMFAGFGHRHGHRPGAHQWHRSRQDWSGRAR